MNKTFTCALLLAATCVDALDLTGIWGSTKVQRPKQDWAKDMGEMKPDIVSSFNKGDWNSKANFVARPATPVRP